MMSKTSSAACVLAAAIGLLGAIAGAQDNPVPPHIREADKAKNQSITRVKSSLELVHRNLNRALMKCWDGYGGAAGFLYPALGKADLSINPMAASFVFTHFELSVEDSDIVVRAYNFEPAIGEGPVEFIRAVKPMAEQGDQVDCKALGFTPMQLRPKYR